MLIGLVVLAVLVLDQLGKYYIQTHLEPGASVPVIDGLFHITYILNPGAAFGIMKNQTVLFLLVALVLFAIVLIIYPRLPAGHLLLRVGIGMQVGGAAGNFIDRFRTGCVVDFFDFRIWPVFNIADIGIVLGVALILYDILYLSVKEGKSRE